jgi:hypothetical protein
MSHHHVDGQTCHKIASRTPEDGAKCQSTVIEGLGSLTPLKTTLELRRGDAIVQVYIAKVPVRAANEALR